MIYKNRKEYEQVMKNMEASLLESAEKAKSESDADQPPKPVRGSHSR